MFDVYMLFGWWVAEKFLFFSWVMVVGHLQWPGGHCNTQPLVCCRQRNGWPRFDFILNRLIAYGPYGPSGSCSYQPFSSDEVSFLIFIFLPPSSSSVCYAVCVCVEIHVFLWVIDSIMVVVIHLCFVPALLGRRVFVSYQRLDWLRLYRVHGIHDKIV